MTFLIKRNKTTATKRPRTTGIIFLKGDSLIKDVGGFPEAGGPSGAGGLSGTGGPSGVSGLSGTDGFPGGGGGEEGFGVGIGSGTLPETGLGVAIVLLSESFGGTTTQGGLGLLTTGLVFCGVGGRTGIVKTQNLKLNK